jgi:beta-phosphoglucomutase family hydrolase
MIKAAIFDMDGIMIDSEMLHSRSFEEVLKGHGVHASKDEHGIIHTPGVKGWDNWVNLKKKYGVDAEVEHLMQKKKKIMLELHREYGIEPLPGLRELVELLKDKNILLAVGTSSIKDRALMVLENLGIKHEMQAIVTGDDVERGKPAPDIYLKAADLLNVLPKECIVFEDAVNGVEAGKAAGMRVIAVPTRYTVRNDFSKADLVVESLENVTWSAING